MPRRDMSLHDCAYCGVMAEERDHVIPACYNSTRHENATYYHHNVVPVCCECNSMLCAKYIPTVADRAAAVARMLAIKHRAMLSLPDWDDDELEEVSDRMRKQIKAKLKCRDLLRARIAYAVSVSGMTLNPEDCWRTVGKRA